MRNGDLDAVGAIKTSRRLAIVSIKRATLGGEGPADPETYLTTGEEASQPYLDSLLRAELVEPAYRASIFSSQPEKRIVVRLTRKAEFFGDAKVLVTLSHTQGEELAARELAGVGETATFDAGELAPGRYVGPTRPWCRAFPALCSGLR